jgi:acetyl esterase/lipase
MARVTRREFAAMAGGSAMALASSSSLAAPAATHAEYDIPFDPAIHVNAELRSIVPTVQQYNHSGPALSLATLPAARKIQADVPPLAEPPWSERSIAGPKGAPAVRLYIINASTPERARPAIVNMHGGGFIFGNAKSSLVALQTLSAAADCVIVSVDYRLAPETRFSGSLEDNYVALKWVYEHAAELGVDKSRIAVMGESAGGGHAAMLAIAARDRGEIPLIYQALVYPMLDDRTGSTRKMPSYIGQLVWTPELNRFGWTSLLGLPAGSPQIPYGAVPARVEDLRKLPPAFIGVGSIDLFVNEDVEYAQRLMQAGVLTELHVVPGAFHGFQAIVPDAPISKQFNSALLNALVRAFTSS